MRPWPPRQRLMDGGFHARGILESINEPLAPFSTLSGKLIALCNPRIAFQFFETWAAMSH